MLQAPEDADEEAIRKRWLKSTDELLEPDIEKVKNDAHQKSLRTFVDLIETNLAATTTLNFNSTIRQSLERAILPSLDTLRVLQLQDWRHKLEMVPARLDGTAAVFDGTRMEAMFGKSRGSLRASIFPMVARVSSRSGNGAQVNFGILILQDPWLIVQTVRTIRSRLQSPRCHRCSRCEGPIMPLGLERHLSFRRITKFQSGSK